MSVATMYVVDTNEEVHYDSLHAKVWDKTKIFTLKIKGVAVESAQFTRSQLRRFVKDPVQRQYAKFLNTEFGRMAVEMFVLMCAALLAYLAFILVLCLILMLF